MTVDMGDIFEDEVGFDGNIPESYRAVQSALDRFVEINNETALDAMRLHTGVVDAAHIRQQIVDIIRNNPPLQTVPTYFRDGREDYLWYSDFYDDIQKDVLHLYGQFSTPAIEITPANYATELAKIDLPYFRELVDLVALEKLYGDSNKIDRKETSEPAAEPEEQPSEPITELPKSKRSYESKLTNEQYSLLARCIEEIKLFRRPASVAQLKKLFAGKLAQPLQVMNQLPLVYLLDKMRDCGYIKKAWMTTAVGNKDFISFRTPGQERRYGTEPHFLTMDQLKSRRADSKRVYIDGGDEIDDAIEQMSECGAKRQ